MYAPNPGNSLALSKVAQSHYKICVCVCVYTLCPLVTRSCDSLLGKLGVVVLENGWGGVWRAEFVHAFCPCVSVQGMF